MLNFAPELKIYLHNGPVDMRKSFDGLFGIVSASFERDVRDGGLFLFINRRRDRLKLLYWDEDGYALWYKRLERGTFELPRSRDRDVARVKITATQLSLILGGIELGSVRRRRRFQLAKAS